jgi:hypothetical protein
MPAFPQICLYCWPCADGLLAYDLKAWKPVCGSHCPGFDSMGQSSETVLCRDSGKAKSPL